MRYTQRFFSFLSIVPLLFFGGCFGVDETPKTDFNPYMPPSFEEDYIEYLSETPSSEPPLILGPFIWNNQDEDISYIDPARKLISFTFDDTPSKMLENILAVFAAYNEQNPDCKATADLFVNSTLVDASSVHLLHLAYSSGFELGNHTHSHFDLTTLTEEELRREIDLTDQVLSQIDGKPRHLLRAPFGRTNELFKTVAESPIIDWSIDTLDWTDASADEIYQRVMSEKFSGAIVLMHDGYQETVEALKRLLPDLKTEGYQIVNVSTMAKAHDCPLKNGSIYIRARKKQR